MTFSKDGIAEHLQAGPPLTVSASRLAGIVNSAMDAIITVDDEQAIILFNATAEKMFGCPASEAIGTSLERFIPERFRAIHSSHVQSFGRTGISTRAMAGAREVYGLRASGEEFPVEASISQIEEDGQKLYTVIMRDISERVRAEERFRQVIEFAPNGMVMVDSKGQITLVNAQIEKSFGYTREELLGEPIEKLVPERFRLQHPTFRNNFIANPIARPMGGGRELFGLRKDGTEFPVEIGLNPLQTDQGVMVLGTIVDITTRKLAEQSLRASEERLNTVIENLSEGLVISDLDGQLVHWNQAGLEMHGFSSMEECLLKIPEFEKIFELSTLDGTVLTLDQWPLPRVIAGERLANYDLCVRRLDRDWNRVFSFGGAIVKEPHGQPLAFVTITDITERKLSEEKLRRNQQQLSGVIESAMDAIITVDETQRIVLFNAAAERMFLFPAEDAVGQPLERFIPERFRHSHKGYIERFGQTRITKRTMGALGAIYGLRADGQEFPVEASISQIESDGQRFYTVIMRDITKRNEAQEALKEQANILDMAPVLICDLQGRIIMWNRGTEELYGWKADEALDKVGHSILKTVFPRPLEEIRARVLSRGVWEGELVHTTKAGDRIVVASRWVLHKDRDGRPKAILEVNNDITERRRAEEEVRRLNTELEDRVADRTAQLQAVNKELEAFSYSVSHDLRAPLRHINGFSQALLEDYSDLLDSGGKSYLNEIRAASQEMAQLIDDVLQLARVTRSEMRREFVDLTKLAREVIAELQKQEPNRNITIDIEEGLAAHGDKRLLKVVLMNLIGNAWKFTAKQPEPKISFRKEAENGKSAYAVRDNGAGFDMAFVEKLFGAFQRLHTAGEFEGTGIGLATVQRIVGRHGGRVWATGAVDSGAAFFFELPDPMEIRDGE